MPDSKWETVTILQQLLRQLDVGLVGMWRILARCGSKNIMINACLGRRRIKVHARASRHYEAVVFACGSRNWPVLGREAGFAMWTKE